jgi:hypothetical protein
MQLPAFLRRDPSEGPEFPEEGASRGYATRGCIFGCLAALFCWVVPIPVVTIVWVFGLKGPFGDYMLIAIPFFLASPVIGAIIAERFNHRHGTNSCHR